MVNAWIEEANACGSPRNADCNTDDHEGVAYFQLTAYNGQRCSSAAAYLRPATQRSSLDVITNMPIDRIPFDDRRGTCVAGEWVSAVVLEDSR